ncbi:MAG: O-antigen ligase family protein [Candidatus Aquicultor sp.]
MSERTNDSEPLSAGTRLETWLYFGLLALVIALPLVMTPYLSADAFDIAKLMALRLISLGIVGIWAFRVAIQKERRIRWSKLDVLLLLFLVLVTVSTIFSLQPSLSVLGKYRRYEGLLTFINYAAIYFLALQSFSSFERIRALSRLLSLIGGVVSIYGLAQFMGFDPVAWPGQQFELWRSFSTFGNPDMLGGFLVLAFPAALASYLDAKSTRDSALYGIAGTLITACLLTSYTRGAWLGTLAGVVVFILVAGRSVLLTPRKLAVITAVLIITFGSIAFYSGTLADNTNLLERISSTSQISEGSAGSRLEIWKAALRATEERPLLGFGPDTFNLLSQRYETAHYVRIVQGNSTADNAHNYFLQLAATLGVPAAICFAIFIIAALFYSRNSIRYRDGDQKRVYAGLVAAAAGYVVYLVVGLSIIGSTPILWLIIGALLSQAYFVRTATVKAAPAIITASAISLTFLVAAYLAVVMYTADVHFNRAMALEGSANPNQTIASFDTATRLYKNGLYLDLYGRYLQDVGLAQHDTSLLLRAKGIAETATDLEPNDSDHWIYLANAYATLTNGPGNGYFDSAEEALNTALAIRPNSSVAQLLLADAYKAEGRYDEVLRLLEFVREVNPTSKEAWLLTAEAHKNLGQKELAITYYKKYQSLNPGDTKVGRIIQGLQANQGTPK